MRSFVVFFLVGWIAYFPTVSAQTSAFEPPKILGVAEYVSSNPQGLELVPVRFLGEVSRPGIYHIPADTDFLTGLSLAGGIAPGANIDKIIVKTKQETLEVDIEDMMSPSEKQLTLRADDVVLVKKEQPWVSQNAVTALTVLSTILGIVVSGIVVSQQVK